MKNEIAIKKENISTLTSLLSKKSVKAQFQNALKDNAGVFTASIVDLFASDNNLAKCDPKDVIAEALKAATLKLPINKALGYAWIVPYKGKPTFQIGYKGLIQLAIRTGQYKFINAGPIYDGEVMDANRITGELSITGEPKSKEVIGYFAYIELINGFKKAEAWAKEKVIAHAKKFSQSFNNPRSAWATDFDAMAKKTVLSALLRTYGILSIEMVSVMNDDYDPTAGNELPDLEGEAGSGDVIDVPAERPEKDGKAEEAGPISEPKPKKDKPKKAKTEKAPF